MLYNSDIHSPKSSRATELQYNDNIATLVVPSIKTH